MIMKSNAGAGATYLPGMSFIQRLFGGGLPDGKLIGLVGPSGGGKTLLATQIAEAEASLGKTVGYIGLEFQNLYKKRFKRLVYGAGDSVVDPLVNQLRSAEWKVLCSRIQLLQKQVVRGWTTENVEAYIAQNQDDLDLVVIDQLQQLLNGRDVSHKSIKAICNKLQTVAALYGIPILLLHQARSAMATGDATVCPTAGDVMQSRDFVTKLVDECLMIGGDGGGDEKVCWIANPKSNHRELAWLDGANGRFRSLGRPGEFFDVDMDLGKFVLSAEAESLGLRSAPDVAGYLQAGFALGQEPAVQPELPDVEVV
ncbi:hypothetical protein PDESU_02662 [Pontiella desulfatans]|uniref:SF4 helicase domain-containing protein n=1 Tax=Pontiella desulfatans TaxID=2750659 RepID=A0A6C2U2N5_PONDE|nr:AAA family ATPase [Pontiella desulfatans]VGO14105.1 hypothetical protein PDESU_02662 [Pontiella desulfatans]